MIGMLIIYLICGVMFDLFLVNNYAITKRNIPMWAVHFQLIVGWLPMIIYSALTQD